MFGERCYAPPGSARSSAAAGFFAGRLDTLRRRGTAGGGLGKQGGGCGTPSAPPQIIIFLSFNQKFSVNRFLS